MLNDKRIDNIRSEYEYIVGIASVQSDANNSGILYLANFSNYIRAETTDVRVFYVFVYVNATSNKVYITAGNFLKDKINITINATYSLPIGVNYAMSDKTNKTWEFGPGVATGNTKTITILYDYKNSQVKETFTVTMNKNFTSGFFDIIIDGDHSIEKKVYYKVTR
ncbi:MAG: hypothetical protein HZB67_03105 [Candidatus Aenigmarchaeota archaeon]|nr:hypothetical protein [Candidatus Aenigmarchaeota archaeon]